jgi:hypothetical protein
MASAVMKALFFLVLWETIVKVASTVMKALFFLVL